MMMDEDIEQASLMSFNDRPRAFPNMRSKTYSPLIFRILRKLNVRVLSIILLFCFGVIFYMGASTSPIIVFVFTVCIISFLLSIYLTKWVLAKDEGPPEMVEISDAIRDGAEGFFRTQYSTISKMAVLLAFVILCIYLFRSLTPQQEAAGLGRAMSAYITVAAFLLGALCSGIAGYVGMWVSVRANVRVSSAARRSAREALQVQYQSDQFLDKNKDYVVAEHQDLLNASKCSFVSGLFPPLPKESSKSKFSSIGTRFKLQLQQLMETLNCTEPHYIRCVKPNNLLQPTVFDNANVLHQLRSGGVLEAIRVKCAGYPTNRTFIEFLNRFVILAPEILKGEYEAEVACKWILEKKGLTGYQIGKSKIFLRAGQMAELDAHRTRVLSEAAKMLQGQVRTRLTRERYVLMRRASVHIQANWRGNLARKISKDMRREEAAIKIQKNLRRAKLRLPPLKWSNSLARYASRWARTRRGDCNLIHSGGPYGENLFWGSGKGWNPRNAVVAWASEKKYYDRRTYRCKANGDCLHYTQLVWKKSSRIGCGINFYKSGDTFIICNYDPPGNIVGQPPF